VSQMGLGQWWTAPKPQNESTAVSESRRGANQRYLPALLATLNAAPFRVRAVELRHQHGMSSRARLPVQAALCHRHRRGHEISRTNGRRARPRTCSDRRAPGASTGFRLRTWRGGF
jgi:hypothetical protein